MRITVFPDTEKMSSVFVHFPSDSNDQDSLPHYFLSGSYLQDTFSAKKNVFMCYFMAVQAGKL